MPVAIAVVVTAMVSPAAFEEPYEPTLVFRFAITSAPLPTPRLKYELLPPHRDRTPGNAAINYLRAVVRMPKTPRLEPEEYQQREDKLAKWRGSKLHTLPVDAVKAELGPFDKVLTTADWAARADRCDWQLPGPPSNKTILNEDIQPLREIMSWLRFRVKVELAEGRYDDALRTLQTGFQMAKHIGEGPTLIQSLVGLAFTAIIVDATAEWGTAPGSPNLYWALATLPSPLIDLRATVVGGRPRSWPTPFPPSGSSRKARSPRRRHWN